jgi:thiamine-monophosphate kinase
VVTTDTLTDQVDFQLGQCRPCRAGRKALAVNLSDLAAMAAQPLAAFVSLVIPRDAHESLPRELFDGIVALAEQFRIAIAGGDTNSWNGPLVISVTALGTTTERGPLRRNGARPGDAILATGTFGGSILGHHFDFTPRVAEALQLHQRYELHAGIDVSDGLALDLGHVCQESGCGALVQLDQVPLAEAAYQLSQTSGRSPLDHALGDGEDFELLLAVPPAEAAAILRDQPIGVPVTRIGQFIDQPGLWSLADGMRKPLPATGYQH